MKILNLYAGIGGNIHLLDRDNYDITSVEIDPEIARINQVLHPRDRVIVADARQYLLDNIENYDYIWGSPPCPSHTHFNNVLFEQGVRRYPDASLFQMIVFLDYFSTNHDRDIKWVIENVRPYYKDADFFNMPPAFERERHWYWSNYTLPNTKYSSPGNKLGIATYNGSGMERTNEQLSVSGIKSLESYYDIKLPDTTLNTYDKRKVLRNCVHPEEGKYIIEAGLKAIKIFKNKSLDDF